MSLKNQIYKSGRNVSIPDTIIEKIILKITGLTKSQLFLSDDINQKYIHDINAAFQKYILDYPIEYILNNAEFYSLDFFVDQRVLIPRNDTEVMVDQVLEIIDETNHVLIDVGTGSSCIAISILKNTKYIHSAFVIDIEKKALEVSEINIKKHNLEKKVTQFQGSLLDPFFKKIEYELGENVIITANLPYIRDMDYENMDRSVIDNEPSSALYGGKNTGFELYEELIKQVKKLKNIYKIQSLHLFIEIGFDQYEHANKYLKTQGLTAKYFEDNTSIIRCIKILM